MQRPRGKRPISRTLSTVARADEELFARIARSDSALLDVTMPTLSRAADFSLLWGAIATGMQAVGSPRAQRAAVRGLVSIGVSSLLTNQILKRIRWRTRPDYAAVPLRRVARRLPTSSSFPSGHSASAAAFAAGVAIEHLPAGIVVGALAAGVGLSRVATGAHYPSDVLAGFAIGSSVAALGARIVPPMAPVLSDRFPSEQFDLPELPDGDGLVIIANAKSGVDQRNDDHTAIEEELPKARIVRFGPGDDLIALVEEAAASANALGACGGDGTVVAVAEVAMRHNLPLAVFPGGTFNHFSRTAHIDTMADAIAAVRGATGTKVDVATLNDSIFLNTSSIGAYPEFVTEREKLQPRYGKRIAAVIAGWRLFAKGPKVNVRIGDEHLTSALFFVGNGQYVPEDLAPLFRPSLADGKLDVRILTANRRGTRPRMAWASLTGTVERSSLYRRMSVEELEVDVKDGDVLIARDGEVDPPAENLRFGVLPQALTVYQPKQTRPMSW